MIRNLSRTFQHEDRVTDESASVLNNVVFEGTQTPRFRPRRADLPRWKTSPSRLNDTTEGRRVGAHPIGPGHRDVGHLPHTGF